MPRGRRAKVAEDVGAEGSSEPEGAMQRVEADVGLDVRRVEARARRSATVWTWVIPAIVFLVVVLIFILQNVQNVKVSFISLHGNFPLALCLLFAAILGALTVAFAEVARSVQLRRRARRDKPPT